MWVKGEEGTLLFKNGSVSFTTGKSKKELHFAAISLIDNISEKLCMYSVYLMIYFSI